MVKPNQLVDGLFKINPFSTDFAGGRELWLSYLTFLETLMVPDTKIGQNSDVILAFP